MRTRAKEEKAMQLATLEKYVSPVAEKLTLLVNGNIPRNGTIPEFVECCVTQCPATLDLKSKDGRSYTLAVSAVASTIHFALLVGVKTFADVTDSDRDVVASFRKYVARLGRIGGTVVTARVALSDNQATWLQMRNPVN